MTDERTESEYVDRPNEAPQFTHGERYELVDLSIKVAAQFAANGDFASAAREVDRAKTYLRELKRLHDGQPAPILSQTQ